MGKSLTDQTEVIRSYQQTTFNVWNSYGIALQGRVIDTPIAVLYRVIIYSNGVN